MFIEWYRIGFNSNWFFIVFWAGIRFSIWFSYHGDCSWCYLNPPLPLSFLFSFHFSNLFNTSSHALCHPWATYVSACAFSFTAHSTHYSHWQLRCWFLPICSCKHYLIRYFILHTYLFIANYKLSQKEICFDKGTYWLSKVCESLIIQSLPITFKALSLITYLIEKI